MVVNSHSTKHLIQPYFKAKIHNNAANLTAAKVSKISFTDKDEHKETAKVSPKGEKLAVCRNLIGGIFSPIKDVLKAVLDKPLPSVIIISTTAAAMRYIKLLGALVSIGICTYGGYKVGTGTTNAIKASKAEKTKEPEDRNYAEANKHIRKVGEGLFDVALTAGTAYKGLNSIISSCQAIQKTACQSTFSQKIYALAKLNNDSQQILSGPKDFKTLIAVFKEEGSDELIKLKSSFTGVKTNDTPEIVGKIETFLTQNPQPQKEEVINLLTNLSKNLKPQQSKQLISVISDLRNENLTSLPADKIAELSAMLSTLKSSGELYPAVAVLKEATRRTDILKVASNITAQVNNMTTPAVSTTDNVRDNETD